MIENDTMYDMSLIAVKERPVTKKTFVIEAAGRRKKIFLGEVRFYKIYSIEAEHCHCSPDEDPMRSYEGMIIFYHRSGETRFVSSTSSRMTGAELSDVLSELLGDTLQDIMNL